MDIETPTLEAINTLTEIEDKFMALDEPDVKLTEQGDYATYVEQCRKVAVDTNSLAVEIYALPRQGVDSELREWVLELKEWYSSYADLYLEWATFYLKLQQYDREHTGVWPVLEAALRGATQFDIFGKTRERQEAEKEILTDRDALDKATIKVNAQRELLMAQYDQLKREYCSRWNWESAEEQDTNT